MRLALKKHVSIRIGQNDDLGSHFLMPELFQMKIFGSFLFCSFTFNLYLGTSWKQPAAEESVAIQSGCGKVLKELRGPVEHSPLYQSPNISADPSCENIWEIFAPRRAARIKKLFSSFFKSRIWLLHIPNFKFIWPAPYLIFVTSIYSGASVKKLTESNFFTMNAKRTPESWQEYPVWCYTQCVILHTVCNFTHSGIYTECVNLHTVSIFTRNV